ncbi:transglutaminase family protein, partial [Propioniciclava sp.]|uniref:transglutaminase family protein n=1 Tax=Propioniciclava sp. TaxID=2038686 RepID=UPI0026325164
MTIRVALHHSTQYTFDAPVTIHPHTVRLRPAPHSRTPIEAYSLTVSPPNHFINWQQDPFGNYLARLVFPEPADHLSITVDLVADMTVINPFDFFVEEYAETFPFAYPGGLREDLAPYLRHVPESPDAAGDAPDLVDAWIERRIAPLGITGGDTRIVDFLVAVNTAVHGDVAYTVRLEPGVQTPRQTLDGALGSCRDSAWLLVSILRRFGLAARFVSGYLVQLTADLEPIDGPAGPEQDFTDLHAWAEVYIPGAGWIGLDATSGLFAGEGHIPLSATPDPGSSAPITGATGVVGVQFAFENTVTRIHEDVRVTKPYTDDQWAGVRALGTAIDTALADADVRLTMGGEPTFVSAGDTSTPQWETAADGPEKRELATRLAGLLRKRWASAGLVQHGQGKWYPGEPLPRWQMALMWRADGVPLWQDQALLADPWGKATLPTDAAASDAQVDAFAHSLAARLGVPGDFVLPAFEDPIEKVWSEARQPWGDRPDADDDPDVDALDATAERPAGWVVPLFVHPDGGWGTARWRPRRRALFLAPGTSPLGLRLPLNSLAWGEQPDITHNAGPDDDVSAPQPGDMAPPATELPIERAPRTAVAVEAREGHLLVFLPPLDALDDAVKLVAAVEGAAAELGTPVVVEGYPLPADHRLTTLSVTPDPGVIEVNVHPTRTWAELEELTTTLYDDARHSGLATEKFDLDGTHTGTGGGNHITLGGPDPFSSPLLRRPDLLQSMITFWQHHPALSYVFSGRFIGPTSQAPRVDEGRHEYLYELEIAFAELEAMQADPDVEHDVEAAIRADWVWNEDPEERVARQRKSQVWLTDRLLRHLLTDLTGNTHRAEFCIDKLYSGDRPGGRLGLLEMRGFEMPPHERMSLVQALLVRALLLRFWHEPYRKPLVRWGTRLHDRFLLPAFATADLRAVVDDLNAHLEPLLGQSFDAGWFAPFLEFRFPRLGETDASGVHLELRGALEPWHVLGEEVSLSGTSRYVDSSVERVQVTASGMVEGRHVLTCNGVPVPMSSAGGPDRVGGVRFRAWAPPSALHPSIGIH